jgi:hypothetical protein
MLCKANPTYMKIKIGNVEIVHALRKAHTHTIQAHAHTHAQTTMAMPRYMQNKLEIVAVRQ